MESNYSRRAHCWNDVWAGLAGCRDRGLHIYDEIRAEIVYRPYARLVEEAGVMAGVLAQRGVRAGQPVLLCAETSVRFPVVWLALVWLGATPAPMPPAWALTGQFAFRERLSAILPYFSTFLCAEAERAQIEALASELGLDVELVTLEELDSATVAASAARVPEPVDRGADDIAFIQFTSGSTKAPKGLRITNRNLFANSAAIWARLEVDPERDRFVSWLPLYHDMGLVGKFLSCLISQTELLLVSPPAFARRPLNFLSLVDEFRANYCCMPNFAYEWILKRLRSTGCASFRLDSLKWLGVGAEPVNPAAMRAFADAMEAYGLAPGVLSPCYGMAEATLAVTIGTPGRGYRLSSHGGETLVTCGEPLDGFDVSVDSGEGHIRIRGESVARTALVEGSVVSLLDDDGYYDTKDIGYFDGDSLVVVGRADEMFIINGENCFPYDIESAARQTPGVLKNRVVCFHVPAGIVLLYETLPVTADQAAQTAEAIERAVLAHTGLPLHDVRGVPSRSIPVTPSGKLQRLKARRLYLDGFYDQAPLRRTSDETALS
jgi:fatty-acyl-CoA synthase